MKKVISIILSLVMNLGLLTVLPAYAQSSLINKVPKTIKIGGTTLTGTYNAKTKTLTYRANNQGRDYEPIYVTAALAQASTDTKVNRDFAAIDPEVGLVFNDMIRSGKIKKLNVYFRNKGEDFDRGNEYTFKTKNGKVTMEDSNMIEGDGYSYKYTYDTSGNIIKFETLGAGGYLTTINHSGDRITSMVDRFTDEDGTSEAKSVPEYDSQGNIIGCQEYYTSGEPMDGSLIAPRKFNSDGTLAEYQVSSEYPIATYTYMEI